MFRKSPEVAPDEKNKKNKVKEISEEVPKKSTTTIMSIRRKTSKKSIKIVLVGDGMVWEMCGKKYLEIGWKNVLIGFVYDQVVPSNRICSHNF